MELNFYTGFCEVGEAYSSLVPKSIATTQRTYSEGMIKRAMQQLLPVNRLQVGTGKETGRKVTGQ
jgi:hypothetical protein